MKVLEKPRSGSSTISSRETNDRMLSFSTFVFWLLKILHLLNKRRSSIGFTFPSVVSGRDKELMVSTSRTRCWKHECIEDNSSLSSLD